ncbi:membrane carboxypeptidase/penicillin-binding protein [Actinomadura citrea]|jgi:membrane carboxypeptidase/penicillin-binding protein|uniref:Membrane carboxypeptidase/penicillin-binding protein n=1 Tax=Actinomadura citrea TaxID=46158 RepID=A0A7Y9GC37_9ACTN|nr:hypothetical protein [Actinomadura citrea]NYE13646.1 membrane carboxypeptidase/penicillin-binding protein [Actinomadura citrea]GGT97486.1 hypothetical protein GCM10010177_65820 [Actinomadura citrea]
MPELRDLVQVVELLDHDLGAADCSAQRLLGQDRREVDRVGDRQESLLPLDAEVGQIVALVGGQSGARLAMSARA